MTRKVGVVFGFGINDADYEVYEGVQINGKRKITWRCPYYARWCDMLKRCYSEKHLNIQPTYRSCSVCDEWKYFSNFKKWMEGEDWKDKELDKDFLIKGNKVYSPDTCIFIHKKINTFLNNRGRDRGPYMIGVAWHKPANKFVSSCNNPFTGKSVYIGLFESEEEAHLAWKKKKHYYALQLADSEYVTDERIRVALRSWFI